MTGMQDQNVDLKGDSTEPSLQQLLGDYEDVFTQPKGLPPAR